MKTWKPFVSGMLAMALLASLAGTAFASGGKMLAGTAGVVILDEVKTEPGAEYDVDGAKIPAVITYEGASGKSYSYLPVQMLPDLLNIQASWSEKRNSIVLGPTAEGASFSMDDPSNPLNRLLNGNPASPVIGASVGPFTEIDPKTVKVSKKPVVIAENKTKVQTVTGFSSGGYFNPELGKYIVLSVQNNGTSPVTCLAGRNMTIGGSERFTSVDIAPGKTLTRMFSIADGANELNGSFLCGVRSADVGTADVTVSLMQYQ